MLMLMNDMITNKEKMRNYTKQDLENIESKIKKNKRRVKVMIILCSLIFLFSLFFTERCIQWYSHTSVKRDAVFNSGVINNNPFTAAKVREVDAYGMGDLKFIGEVYVIIDY